jgi:hypothetical protein
LWAIPWKSGPSEKPKKGWWGIFALHFCFGGTVIGWFFLVWAVRPDSTPQLMNFEHIVAAALSWMASIRHIDNIL